MDKSEVSVFFSSFTYFLLAPSDTRKLVTIHHGSLELDYNMFLSQKQIKSGLFTVIDCGPPVGTLRSVAKCLNIQD